MPTNLHRALCIAALAALPLAACGDDDDSGSGDGGESAGDAIRVLALDSLAFDPDEITAPAGTITIELVNDGSQPHTFVVEGHEDELKLSVGSSDEGSIELEADEYTFYCDVPGHQAAGMEGTLTVE